MQVLAKDKGLEPVRKIIHIDMDCFYAAIEMRDFPELADKPVAVGGEASHRGVISTCNYAARQFGVRSAMPTAQAMKLCRPLILQPVRMDVYQQTTVEQVHPQIDIPILCRLIREGYLRKGLPVRLLIDGG